MAVILPLGVILAVVLIVSTIGETLLASAHLQHEYALIVGLTITGIICIGSFIAAGGLSSNPGGQPSEH